LGNGGTGGVADSKKHAPPPQVLPTIAERGRSALKGVGRNAAKLPKLGSPRAPLPCDMGVADPVEIRPSPRVLSC